MLPAYATTSRVALVIGNGAYAEAGRLPNATQDADDIATALRRLNFDVTAAQNLDAVRFEAAITAFVAKARGADVALFFFAGHALQLGPTNYLMPTDARLANELAVKRETIAAQDVVEQLEGAARMTLVFLDACRNNPLADRLKSQLNTTGRSANVGRGLARIDARGRDTLIVFSAEPGQVAADGIAGSRNSPFAAGLLKHIDTPGLEVESLLKRVTAEVRDITKGQQQPERLSKLQSEFYFQTGVANPSPSGAQQQAAVPDPSAEARIAWNRLESSTDRVELEAFRRQFGAANPFYDQQAQKRLAAITDIARQEREKQDRDAATAARAEAQAAFAKIENSNSIAAIEAFRKKFGADHPSFDRKAEKRIADLRSNEKKTAAPSASSGGNCSDFLRRATQAEDSGQFERAKSIWAQYAARCKY